MGVLDGQVACITGAARGQGRSHAVALAREGASIIALDACAPISTVPYQLSTTADLDHTVEAVEGVGGKVFAAQVDVRDLGRMEQVVADAVSQLGRLDIVCCNAGISTPSPTLEMDEQVWQETIDVNLTGVWKTCRATIPHIRAGGRGGSVIIISSAATRIISGNIAHYTASKYGVVGLMKVLAKELAAERIRVNTVHPTGVQTPMILNEPMYRLFRPDLADPVRADFEESARTHNAMGVFALEPEDVSGAVLYLAANTGRYITGTEFMIDAGGQLR
jgi:SDR family mycofactocin-dependent oxidoreductase